MLIYILFVIGFVFLIKGADLLVSGASSIARRLGIPALVVGLTIVAFGTSSPELAVNIISAFQGNSDIALGNILGSNISNILLILGVTACIIALPAAKSSVFIELPFSLLVLGIVFVLFIIGGNLGRLDGAILSFLFLAFLYYNYRLTKNHTQEEKKEDEKEEEMTVLRSAIYLIVGLLGLSFGGKWIVDGAVHIASLIGMSELVVGLTIVAIGTSLPELATSVVAALKKQNDIAIGNIIGSNIFNIILVLGTTSLIHPIAYAQESLRDFVVAGLATIALFAFLFFGKKYVLDRFFGSVLILSYIVYLGVILYMTL